MPKEPEDFSKVEDKFKLSFLNLQKRLTDLEVAISEVKASVEAGAGKADETAQLAQRIEDIEDLIMVEQAGIVELQRMMQSAQERFESLGAEVPEEVERRMETLESDIDTIKTTAPAIDLQPVKDQIGVLQSELDGLKKLVESGAGPRIDFLTSRIDNLKANLAEYTNKNVEMELKVEGLEKSLAAVENQMVGATPVGLNEKLESNKKDIIMLAAKLESAESVIKNLSEQTNELDMQQKKLGSFEKLSLLGKEVEDKIERFKFIEDELRRLSSRMEMLYSSIDQRIEKMKGLEKELSKSTQNILALADEVDKNRIGLLTSVKKEELNDILSSRLEGMNKKIDSNIDSMSTALDSMSTALQSHEKMINDMDASRIKPISDRLNALQSMQSRLEGMVKGVKLEEIRKVVEDAKARAFATESKIQNMDLDTQKRLQNIDLETKDKLQEMELRLKVAEETDQKAAEDLKAEIRTEIDAKIAELHEPSALFETQINELLDRFVFLESRLAAIEAMVQKTISTQPIVLE